MAMLLVAALATVGLAISLYIWRKQVTGAPLLCLTRDCHRVINSPYARLFGVPNGALGALMFAALAVLALAIQGKFLLPGLWVIALIMTGAGLVLAAYLTYVQFFILRGLCSWCLLSATLTVAIFVLLLSRY